MADVKSTAISWLKNLLSDLTSDTITEIISFRKLKSFLAGSMSQSAQATAGGQTTEEGRPLEVPNEGNKFIDTPYFLKLFAELEEKLKKKNPGAVIRIADFMNANLNSTQKDRFRVAIAILDSQKYISGFKNVISEIPQGKGKDPIKKKEPMEKKESVAILFLEHFAILTDEQRLSLCDAAGILESDFERKLKKVSAWTKQHHVEAINTIGSLNKAIASDEPEQGWFHDVFGFSINPFSYSKKTWVVIAIIAIILVLAEILM